MDKRISDFSDICPYFPTLNYIGNIIDGIDETCLKTSE